MNITRKSTFSGITRTVNMPVTQAQIDAWEAGALIQNAMPHLSPDEREFLKTGVTAEEWASIFGSEDTE